MRQTSVSPAQRRAFAPGSGGPNAVFATAGVLVSEAGAFDLQLSWPAINASRGAIEETDDETVGGAPAVWVSADSSLAAAVRLAGGQAAYPTVTP